MGHGYTTYSKELSERGVVGLAGLAFDVLQVLCEPEAQAGKQAAKLVVRVANAGKDVGSVEVMPVLCAGMWFGGWVFTVWILSGGVPRLGMGSSSWAGNEKRTAAMSETPMNLRRACQWTTRVFGVRAAGSHFFRMPTKVLSLLLSSGVFSPTAAPGPGVDALDDCSEAGAERPEDDEAMVRGDVSVHKAEERDTSVLVGQVGQGCDPQSQLLYRGA
jgi:hypothetical protein